MVMALRPAIVSEDLETLVASDTENDAPQAGAWSKGRIAAATIGVACLVACAVASAIYMRPIEGERQLTARQLLESPEMIDVMTSNSMKTAKVFEPKDEHDVRNKVQSGLKDILSQIKTRNPPAFERLNSLVLTPEKRRHLLHVVASMSDPRVQQIGYEVAKTVHEHKEEGRAAVKRHLMEKFQSRTAELGQLKGEIYETMGENSHFTFNPEHMRIVRAVPDTGAADLDMKKRRLDGTGSEMTDTDMTAYAQKFEQGLGLIASLIEQARVCLDQIDFVGESFGVDMKIPYWAKSLVGGLDFVSELSDCVMRADSNYMKTMMCPMKYASAFSDFMSSLDNIFGVSNGHMGMFGGGSSGQSTDSSGTAQVSSGWNFASQTTAAASGWNVAAPTTTTAGWGR